jgi:4-amino-4-deoxy-L-arabinose transferase-like glycosyltransferase
MTEAAKHLPESQDIKAGRSDVFGGHFTPKTAVWILFLLIGTGLAGYGQFVLSTSTGESDDSILGIWLSQGLRLSIPQIDYVLQGAGLLLAGLALVVWVIHQNGLFGREEQSGWHIPASIPPLRSITIPIGISVLTFFGLILQVAWSSALPVLLALWLTSMLSGLYAAAQIDIHSETPLSPNIKKRDILWLSILLAAGLLVGIYRLQGIPDQLMGDEGEFWSNAQSLAAGTYTPLPSPFALGVYSYPILSSYFQALVLKIFGATLWSWRFSSVLAGLATILPLYLLARELFDRRVAVLSGFAMLASAYYLAFSRLGYNNIQSLFPVTLALYLGYIGLKRSSAFYLLAAGIVAGFGFYTYTAGRSGLVILGLFIFLLLIKQPSRYRNLIAAGSLILCGWVLCALPHLAYGASVAPDSLNHKMYESLFMGRDFARAFFSDQEINGPGSFFWGAQDQFVFNARIDTILLLRGLIRTLLVFHIPNLVTEHFITSPLAGNIGAPFYALGLLAVIISLRQRRSLILLSWFVVSVIALSAANTFAPRHQHLVSMIPLIALLIGHGLTLFASGVAHVWERAARPIGIAILVLGMGAIALNGMYDYFVRVPQEYYPLFENAINWRGLYNPERKFVYVYGDPALSGFQPLVIRYIVPGIPYETIQADTLPQRISSFGQDTVVFFEENVGQAVARQIEQAWPSAGKTVIATKEHFLLGYVYAGRPLKLPANQSPGEILADSYARPGMWLLLFPAITLAILALLNDRRAERLPAGIRTMLAWFSQDPSGLDDDLKPNPAATLFPPIFARLQHRTQAEQPAPSAEPEPAQPARADETPAAIDEPAPAPTPGRFIELEFRLRINLDNAPWVWQPGTRRPLFSVPGWLSRALAWIKSPEHTKPSTWKAEMPPAAVWLVLPFFLAFIAQFMIASKWIAAGIVVYLLAAAGLIAWVLWKRTDLAQLLEPATISHRAEFILMGVILILAVFARFYNAGNFPYGIEGDESKWALQAYYSAILGEERGNFLFHFQHQPVSFYLIGTAMRVLGINLLTPRYLNALLSSISVLLLYLIARRATRSPLTAMISTVLYAFSFAALSAGRQALHDTYIEIWVNLAFFLLLLAIDRKNDLLFLLAGTSVVLGIASYETGYPSLAIVGLIMLVMWIKNKAERRLWLRFAILTFLPFILYAPTFFEYIGLRQDFHLASLRESSGQSGVGAIAFFTTNFTNSLTMLFSHVVWDDSLMRWGGPLVNPWILPFFVIGLIVSVFNLRKEQTLLIVLWFLLGFFPFSLFGADHPRVIYMSTMAIFILAAIGMTVCLSVILSTARVLEVRKMVFLTVVSACFLVMLAGIDISIFTTKLADLPDRKIRRELLEIFSPALGGDTRVYLPIIPGDADVIEQEKDLLDMTVQGTFHFNSPAERYEIIPFQELLARISTERLNIRQASVIFDKTSQAHLELRRQALSAILSCFPKYVTISGQYFDSYIIDTHQSPRCISLPPPTLAEPAAGTVLASGKPIHFSWGAGWQTGNQPPKFRLIVERQNPQIYWIEAETMQANGWFAESLFASDYTGSGYLTDSANSSPTLINLNLLEAGKYDLWVRTYRRATNDQHNYIALDMFPSREISLVDVFSFDRWVWEKVGSYDLKAGAHSLALSRTYGTDPQFSLFIDAIVLSSLPAYNPEQTNVWTVVHDSGVQLPATHYTLSEKLLAGTYRWHLIFFMDGNFLLDWDGTPGTKTTNNTFQLAP